MEKNKSIQLWSGDVSKLITPHPCWLYSFCLSSNAGVLRTFELWDGENSDGIKKISLSVFKLDNSVFVFQYPQFFRKGIYIYLSGGQISASLQYEIENEML